MVSRERRVSLSPTEKYQHAISARRKFRAIVKLIIANLNWLQEIEDEKLGDNVKKNIMVLTRKKGKKSILTLQDKSLLNKPLHLRTEEEKAHLRKILGNIKYFRRYPSSIKDELPSIMLFNFFGPNRVILRQNYEPENFYIILTGEVLVSRMYYDRLLKKEVSKDLVVMGPGNVFGEVALVHDINRIATVTTLEASEFLYIRRDDFDRVLKSTVAEQWAKIEENLSWFPYFQNWTAEEIREACILARQTFFEPEQIVLSTAGGHQDCIYFVTKGRCYLIEHITIKTVYKKGIPHYSLIEETEEQDDRIAKTVYKDIKSLYRKEASHMQLGELRHSLRPPISTSRPSLRPSYVFPQVRMHFMNVCTFRKMACFNVGESLKNRIIVSAAKTECLLLPRYFLMEKAMLTFRSIEHFLTHNIPNTATIFAKFLEDRKWNEYKHKLVDEILSQKKKSTNNNIHNVPYMIRLCEDLGEI
ncbi:cNMP binding domain containing protein [Asbolus verrucosus]|uniref:cNMP binding domain containing protein n=1 Tax=Asbolus verrucosus TaxID=1661398 RepID=A0A482VFN1_ASBVE|nr:cNMP binding domain containing protein [Asbolus verrucosus]